MRRFCIFVLSILLTFSITGCAYEHYEPEIDIPDNLDFVQIWPGANLDVKVLYSTGGNYSDYYFNGGEAVETDDGFQVILDFKLK